VKAWNLYCSVLVVVFVGTTTELSLYRYYGESACEVGRGTWNCEGKRWKQRRKCGRVMGRSDPVIDSDQSESKARVERLENI
jgi:hypothetical protein